VDGTHFVLGRDFLDFWMGGRSIFGDGPAPLSALAAAGRSQETPQETTQETAQETTYEIIMKRALHRPSCLAGR
jgi:hypothetical protein